MPLEGAGRQTGEVGYTILFSGRNGDHHSEGVALIVRKDEAKSLIDLEPVNERLIRTHFNSSSAPTNEAEDEMKDA